MQISSKQRAAAFFTSSATFPLCLCLSVSLVSDEFFPDVWNGSTAFSGELFTRD